MSEEQSKEPKDKQENQPEIKAEKHNEKKEMKKEVFQQHQEIEKLQAEKDEILGGFRESALILPIIKSAL